MVYWLVLKPLLALLPLRLLVGIVLVVLGLQGIGLDVVTPAIDYVVTLVEGWIADNVWSFL